ncbi:S-adenosyl-L-methionine-dependent methyltransferase [Macroventuria anomochaeta]|uniref:S-adenosyl-L-methionine-dependent methyltransferase n=1 Tax=Macroventuria anomochaeta TaxID=301207 RepID=A0ACB6S644_9PLEO|nr:S-adenosyl-L-methionine-dependent methyltransferase [Macroventuria anomochaeta]KAF2629736.1 S-adenosyl-L-methionine-dependent methyltransferase [Macroventuria anomochaeta]
MSVAELNRKYFDTISDSYDTKPWFATVNTQVANELRSRLSWIGIPFANTGSASNAPDASDASDTSEVRLLDYACGTGLMTRIFSPYVTKTLGIDISPNMVSTYKSRAASAGLPPSTVDAVVGDLFNKSNPRPEELNGKEWWDFDIATVGFGFHHFEDVVHAARQLKERLRPGGALVINEFLEGGDLLADENGHMVEGSEGNHAVHKHGHGHGHHGHGHKHEQEHSDDKAHHVHNHSHSHSGKHEHTDKHHTSKEGDFTNPDPELRKKMNDSIVVPHFTIDGVKEFFTAAGFVHVDVITLKERSYMEFGGKKMWRTILIAKGMRPEKEGEVGYESGRKEC